MKFKFISFVIFFLSINSFSLKTFASETLLLRCKTSFKTINRDKSVTMDLNFYKSKDKKTKVKVEQTMNSFKSHYTDSAEIIKSTIRTDLVSNNASENTDSTELNFGEKAILLADELLNDESYNGAFKDVFTLNIDLSSVAYTEIYLVGKPTASGSTYVVKAFDSHNNLLGTFLGGYLLSQCMN